MDLNVMDLAVLAGATIWIIRLLLSGSRRSNNGIPHPPGPKALPIVGNYFDMPKSHDCEQAAEWGKTYGDIVYVETFGSPTAYVNSYAVAIDLLEKRSSIYSSRPDLVMANELEGWDWKTSLMPYGDRLKKHRAYLHRFFQPSAVAEYAELETQETHKLLREMLRAPTHYADSIRHMVGGVLMMISYGHEVARENDVYVTLADDGLRALGEVLVKGRFLVDYFPSLKYVPEWFPGAGFKKTAREGYKLSKDMMNGPHEMTKEKILSGTAPSSMTSQLIEANTDESGNIIDEDIIAGATGIAYSGGTDTTVSALLTFVLAMVLYPEVQRRGQLELDKVIGKDCLPTFDDRENMPYVNAICTEILRWEVVIPLGVSHCTTEDDVYNGYFIPRGTAVLANQWAMLRDPKLYSSPDVFMPERWLPPDGENPPLHPNRITFGFGRRICPGRHFAEDLIFIAVASMLAAFDMRSSSMDDGSPPSFRGEYVPSLIRHPEPFKCSITPRSKKIEEVINQAVEVVTGRSRFPMEMWNLTAHEEYCRGAYWIDIPNKRGRDIL